MRSLFKIVLVVAVCSGVVLIQVSAGRDNTSNSDATQSTAPAPMQSPTQLPVPTPTLTSVVPYQIPPHVSASPEQVRPFFDWFSWESFVALSWPATVDPTTKQVTRGVPDTTKSIGDLSVPRVWESWKADWELYRPASTGNPKVPGTPSDWSSYNLDPQVLPCTNAAGNFLSTGGKLLVMSTKMDSVLNQVNQAFAPPLIAWINSTYVRYEIRINQSEYNYIKNPPPPYQPLYIYANLPTNPKTQAPLNFPSTTPGPPAAYGPIEVKAAWRELSPAEDASRYYWVSALVVDQSGITTCRQTKMALVGLHIAHKVAPFREWVWSTFEHVDNVPQVSPDPPGCPQTPPSGTYSLNSGTGTPTAPNGYNVKPPSPKPPLSPTPTPKVQVQRVLDIPDSTKCMNSQFQQALKGTVWQYYMLVATQWPTVTGSDSKFQTPGSGGVYPLNCDVPFPADPVANVTMETYYQVATTPATMASCMHCHYAASQYDFSFMLPMSAFQPSSQLWTKRMGKAAASRVAPGPANNEAVIRLRQFLQTVGTEQTPRRTRRRAGNR